MPENKYNEFRVAQYERASSAATEEERVEALRRMFCAMLAECAEETIDDELAPVNGIPVEPGPGSIELRPDSMYYPYNLARRNAFAGFTDEQKKILRGLIQHTAFAVMDGIFHRLDHFKGFEVGISLYPKSDVTKEHRLHSPQTHELIASRAGIPEILTKYEY